MAQLPDETTQWATDTGATIEPSSGVKATGWQGGEEPAAEHMNWLQNLDYQWQALQDEVYRGQKLWRVESWDFVTANLDTDNCLWTDTGGFATTIENPTSVQRFRHLKLAGGAGIDSSAVGTELLHYFDTDSDVDLEFTAEIDSYGSSTNFLVEAGLVMGASDLVVFERDEADAAWFYRCQSTASGTTRATTGITATAGQVYRMRIQYRGHASTPTARFWIDGALVATVTDADVPRALTGLVRFKNQGLEAVNTIGDVHIGPVAWGIR